MKYTSNSRLGWLDLIRGFLMCLVFLYHCEVFYGTGHSWSWFFEPIFLTGFFFVSGYLYTLNWEKVTIKVKWMQVLRGVLIPYYFFMFTFLIPKIVLLHYDWRQTVEDIFLLRASWFVIAIGFLQLLYALTLNASKKVSVFVALSILYTLIGYVCVLLYRNLPEWYLNNKILYSEAMPGCMPACLNLVFLATPFFSMGMLYRKYENKLRVTTSYRIGVIMLILYLFVLTLDHHNIGSSLCYAGCSSNNLMLVIIYFLLAMFALIAICKKIHVFKVLNYIGGNTLLFYYFNIVMLRVAGTVYDKVIAVAYLDGIKELLGYGNCLVVTLMAISFTFPLVWFINKYLPLLTGKKKEYIEISKKLNININW